MLIGLILKKLKLKLLMMLFYIVEFQVIDGSEDELFKGFDLLNKYGFIEDGFNNDDTKDMSSDIKVEFWYFINGQL